VNLHIKIWLPFPAAALLAGNVLAAEVLPMDVSRFVERRTACDHFRGEEPYDAERRAYLEQQMRDLCTGTDAQLRALKRKYRHHPPVLTRLKSYDPAIE
jgi:hypothetical protein